ncbi:hypothetical protein RCH14_003034 [Massilia sp. MP_M2]|uniref:hypothetical protein n=1 Tax=Massilia sp. MP_M2 TaxID=3071713 RepID=UPI00319E0B2B
MDAQADPLRSAIRWMPTLGFLLDQCNPAFIWVALSRLPTPRPHEESSVSGGAVRLQVGSVLAAMDSWRSFKRRAQSAFILVETPYVGHSALQWNESIFFKLRPSVCRLQKCCPGG